jgi:phage-related holin
MKKFIAENVEKIMTIVASLVAGIFIPVVEILLFTGFVLVTDTITGIWAAKSRGERIHSSKMKRVLSKLLLYPAVIIIASWAEKILPAIPFIDGAAVILISVEGKSILENVSDILGYNILKLVKAYISDGGKGVLEFKNKKDEKNNK